MQNTHYIDLHVHSFFSRATSPQLTLENVNFWALRKGVSLMGTGDLSHPLWLKTLKEKLVLKNNGFYTLKNTKNNVYFVPTGEISLIYKKKDKTRKIHLVVVAPNLEVAEKLSNKLGELGNIEADGRPILGIDAKDFLDICLNISEDFEIIPAHIWTPWFSLFGSKSGFNALEECFEDLTKYIHALETGLSSDPEMNRLISALDKYNLVSFSDAHSLEKIAREATIISGELTYKNLLKVFRTGENLVATCEFFPEEGKYHLDGHSKCNISLLPHETKKLNGKCPVCGKALTVGVFSRVYEFADRETALKSLLLPDVHLVPLEEILAEIYNQAVKTIKVKSAYDYLLKNIATELDILTKISIGDLEKKAGSLLALSIERMRNKEINLRAGYDGQFGLVQLLNEAERKNLKQEGPLFEKIKIAK